MGYYITSEDDFSHTLIGGAAQNITLNSKITLEQYTRILFLNYPGSNDGALLAIAPGDKIITAFRNNGVWEEKSSQFIATKSDLTDHIRYENVSVTIPASARYIDAPLSYICNYVRSVLPVNGDGLTIVQSSRLESKKVRIYVVASETERRSTVCIGYS